MNCTADMRKDLICSMILLVSLMAFESIISAEDDDDVALAKINNLLIRFPRMTWNENDSPIFRDSNIKRELESKLSNLLEFSSEETKWPVVREDAEEDEATIISSSEVSPFMRFDPVDTDEEEESESAEDDDDEDNESRETTKHTTKFKNKHAKLVHKIRQKLTDRKNKFTISVPVAIIVVGSIILVTCCCALYLRNRLVACMHTLTGRNKKKSKMLVVDTERGRITPRSRTKSVASSNNNKKRARSISFDMVNVGTQQSGTIKSVKDIEEESTTGCYQCCKKKKKRQKK